jgi:beta-galactosidase
MKNAIAYFRSFVTISLLVISGMKGFAQELEKNRKQLFDYDWKFFLGNEPKAGNKEFDDANWRSLDLPHDWSIEGITNAKNPTGNDGGYFPAGIGWYRKKFTVPATWKGKRISIYFEGVYMNSEVFINGKPVGVYPYGYSSFHYDLTPDIKYGEPNTIAVRVDNSKQKNCRWYSGSGIYRHVWLNITNPIHVAHWGVFISTPEVNSKRARVQLKTIVKNETAVSQNIQLSTTIYDKSAITVSKKSLQIQLPANSEQEVIQQIIVNNPSLWSPDAPHLYTAQMEVKQQNKLQDKIRQSFGIRSIQFSADKGFELNGKSVKLNGGCVHHDNGCLGAAAFDRAEERKIALLKAAGFNAVRTSHNPPSEAFLYACDKLGKLVIDEAFDGWKKEKTKHDYANYFNDWWQRDLEAMVKRDRNHPSIIMWSIGNEIIERKEPQAVETANLLAHAIKQTDPTRPVTSAMTTWDKDWEIFDPLMAAHDVAGYNYQLHRAAADHARVPARIIVQTESYPRDAFANWELVQKHPYIIGDFVWTAMDYLGESGIGRYYYPGELEGQHWERDFFPWHGAYCGDIDLTGWRKPISHYRSLLYNDNEKIYLAVREPNSANGAIKETMWSVWPTWESWTWPGYEGKNLQVEVYSKYSKVRLYINDSLFGEQPTTKEQQFKATFTLPYSPGVLKTVGVQDGKEMGAATLKTAGNAAGIRLTPDRTVLSANGQDLSFFTIEVIDKAGTVQPNYEGDLNLAIEGPGVIAGVDNANLKDTASYVTNTRKAWHGRALVVVKSSRTPGNITLKISSPGLPGAVMKIRSELGAKGR